MKNKKNCEFPLRAQGATAPAFPPPWIRHWLWIFLTDSIQSNIEIAGHGIWLWIFVFLELFRLKFHHTFVLFRFHCNYFFLLVFGMKIISFVLSRTDYSIWGVYHRRPECYFCFETISMLSKLQYDVLMHNWVKIDRNIWQTDRRLQEIYILIACNKVEKAKS